MLFMIWVRVGSLSLLVVACACSGREVSPAPSAEPNNSPVSPISREAGFVDAANQDSGPSDRDASRDADQGLATVPGAGQLPTLARIEDSRRMTRPVFERMVKDPDVVVRRRAVLALARMRRAEGLAPLRSALDDADEEVRTTALFAIGNIEASAHDEAEEVVTAFLAGSPTAADRRAAVSALGNIGSDASEPLLLEALESPEPRLRAAAAKALGLTAMRGEPPQAPPAASLAPRLTDEDSQVRLAAAFAFSRGARPADATAEAVTATLEKLFRSDPEPEVRIMAGRALSNIGLASPKVALAVLQHDADWRVRTAAAHALGRGAPPEKAARAMDLIWTRIEGDPSKLSSPELHGLLALLDAAESRAGAGYRRGLARIHRSAGKLLDTESTDSRQRLVLTHVKCRAALALDRTRGRPALVHRCAEGPEKGLSHLQQWEVDVLVARAWMGSPRPQALPALRKLARHEDPRVRIAAIQAAETLPTEKRLSLFERALSDVDAAVVASAAHGIWTAASLFEVEERPTEQLVVTEHTPAGPITHEISNEGVSAPPIPAKALSKALEVVNPDGDVETAIYLLKVIGRLKVAEGLDKASTFARHHNPAVRGEARKAMEAMEREPGDEIAPDPPNLIDPADMSRLAELRPRVIFVTSAGTFVMELRPDLSPGNTANMLTLVRSGFYRRILFHRVVPGFVAQVGDPGGTGYGGPGYTVRCEVTEAPYRRGSVGMALAGPDTGGSQIFITYSAQPHLDGRYTLFGNIVQGMDIVESIQSWDLIIEAYVEGEAPPPVTETQGSEL